MTLCDGEVCKAQCYVHKYRNLEAMLCRQEVGQKERTKQIKLILDYNKEVKGSPTGIFVEEIIGAHTYNYFSERLRLAEEHLHPGMLKHLKKFKNKFVKHYRKSLPTGLGHSKKTTTIQLKKLNDFIKMQADQREVKTVTGMIEELCETIADGLTNTIRSVDHIFNV